MAVAGFVRRVAQHMIATAINRAVPGFLRVVVMESPLIIAI
jgi:hypothetical protein